MLLVNTLDRPGLLTGEGSGIALIPVGASCAVQAAGWGRAWPMGAVLRVGHARLPLWGSFPHSVPPLLKGADLTMISSPAKLSPQSHPCYQPCPISVRARLTDIVRVLKDINLNVVSAEVDTIGRNAFDRFNIT